MTRQAQLLMNEPAVKAAFERFDADGSGSVDAKEIGEILKAANAEISPEELDTMLKRLDKDGSGELDRDEFLCLLNQLFPENCDENETYVDREFAAADADRSRTLSFVEFERYYPQVTWLGLA